MDITSHMNLKKVFSGVCALALIIFYVCLIDEGLTVIECKSKSPELTAQSPTPAAISIQNVNSSIGKNKNQTEPAEVNKNCKIVKFTEKDEMILKLIVGLVSALIISQLAITPAKEIPGRSLLPETNNNTIKNSNAFIVTLYIGAWFWWGGKAFYFGYLNNDLNTLPIISDIGWTWFSFIVGAAYAYFGLEPNELNKAGK